MIRPLAKAARAVLLLLLSGLLLSACSSEEVGFGAPAQPSTGAYGGLRGALTGSVVVQSNGCVDLDLGVEGLRWIVWPSTAEVDEGQPLFDGRPVAGGVVLAGLGALAEADVLPGWSEDDSYFGSFGRYCAADVHGVVIFDSVAIGP
ncbi:MAG: hypothetical protein ACTMIR_03330 [Cellulomonadaceae bacterium]